MAHFRSRSFGGRRPHDAPGRCRVAVRVGERQRRGSPRSRRHGDGAAGRTGDEHGGRPADAAQRRGNQWPDQSADAVAVRHS